MTDLPDKIPEWLEERILKIYSKNVYANYLGMKIVKLMPLEAIVSMKSRQNLMNMLGGLHGGAITSIADMVMGLACATVGKRIVTLGMNINFMYAANLNSTVFAFARIVHNGRRTLVVEFRILDSETNRLLSKGRGTFFVIGQVTREIENKETAQANA